MKKLIGITLIALAIAGMYQLTGNTAWGKPHHMVWSDDFVTSLVIIFLLLLIHLFKNKENNEEHRTGVERRRTVALRDRRVPIRGFEIFSFIGLKKVE